MDSIAVNRQNRYKGYKGGFLGMGYGYSASNDYWNRVKLGGKIVEELGLTEDELYAYGKEKGLNNLDDIKAHIGEKAWQDYKSKKGKNEADIGTYQSGDELIKEISDNNSWAEVKNNISGDLLRFKTQRTASGKYEEYVDIKQKSLIDDLINKQLDYVRKEAELQKENIATLENQSNALLSRAREFFLSNISKFSGLSGYGVALNMSKIANATGNALAQFDIAKRNVDIGRLQKEQQLMLNRDNAILGLAKEAKAIKLGEVQNLKTDLMQQQQIEMAREEEELSKQNTIWGTIGSLAGLVGSVAGGIIGTSIGGPAGGILGASLGGGALSALTGLIGGMATGEYSVGASAFNQGLSGTGSGINLWNTYNVWNEYNKQQKQGGQYGK